MQERLVVILPRLVNYSIFRLTESYYLVYAVRRWSYPQAVDRHSHIYLRRWIELSITNKAAILSAPLFMNAHPQDTTETHYYSQPIQSIPSTCVTAVKCIRTGTIGLFKPPEDKPRQIPTLSAHNRGRFCYVETQSENGLEFLPRSLLGSWVAEILTGDWQPHFPYSVPIVPKRPSRYPVFSCQNVARLVYFCSPVPQLNLVPS